MTYDRSSKYPAQMFDLLEAVAGGAAVEVECADAAEAKSERKHWYSFISLLRREKHPAALYADRVVIRTEANRIIWEPRIGGRMARIASEALAKIGKATPTAPSNALQDLVDKTKELQKAAKDKAAAYLGKDKE
jgi:hypothetical protein